MNLTKRQTIAIVSNTSWSIYNFRLGLIQYLKENGFDVLVIAPKDAFSSKLISEGFHYHHVDIQNYGINPIYDIRTTLQLSRIYRKYKVDFIFHYTIKPNIYGTCAAAWCRIPSIAVTTGLGHMFTFRNDLLRFLIVNMYRFAAFLSREVWFLNETDQQTFINNRIVKSEKTYLLPSEGVNTQYFVNDCLPLKHETKTLTFLFAGRLLWDKGVGELVEAARYITQKYDFVNFELLGFIDLNNPNSVMPEQITAWQDEKILHYLGETTDVKSILCHIDCLVFPSYYREGISRILLEAASMGKPIITTDNIGCREVVSDNETGYLCKPQNAQDLIEKIERFIQLSPSEKEEMGTKARQKMVSEFDEKIILQLYMNKINQHLIPSK
ncbi:MAG: glycosyltransferase family 4 protein [Saprospiraceae bacterium]|nr:glycosyltransferase family 4 protein [Saprospiraceae bacterium]